MSESDAAAHLAGEDDEMVRWLNGAPGTLASARSWIERNRRAWEQGGPIFGLGIEEVASGRVVGMVEANTDHYRIEGIRPGEANISYALYPEARGKGYATRAVRLILRLLGSRGVTGAVIPVDPRNTRSIEVARRCGFRRSGSVVAADGTELVVFRRPTDPDRPA
jgi:RimJ/RimL family protein N-acetyltransferase